ncbi:MAG: TRAP transporter small permease subunit [Azospirillum sp.]|nr:TRAP transporter small permease subunit [Azospirillum sp.]
MIGRITANLEEGLIAILLAGMTVLTFTQVVLRYIFNSGLLWGLEATTYMFGWLILLGISYGVRVNAHIGVDLAVKSLPPLLRRLVGVITIALCLLYAGMMFWGSYYYVEKLERLGVDAQDIEFPRWILTLALPLGFALLGVRLIQVLIDILKGRRQGFELADEAADVIKEFGGEAHPDASSESGGGAR